jgi:hypothetical protein
MPPFNRSKVSAPAILMVAALTAWVAPATAQQPAPVTAAQVPFTATLSNNTPLAFGMDAPDAARALGAPLSYVSGRPGDEILLAFRNVGGSGLFYRNDRLYLQFRHGRLAGWKGDWGSRSMWR